MNDVTLINERYFNDTEDVVSTSDIEQQTSSSDTNKNVTELVRSLRADYNYILDIVIYNGDTSKEHLNEIVHRLNQAIDNVYTVYDVCLRPLVFLTRPGVSLTYDTIINTPWQIENYSNYNFAVDETILNKNFMKHIHIVYSLSGNFKNSKYLANLYYITLRSLSKETYVNIHKNDSFDLESKDDNRQFLALDDFKKKDLDLIIKAIAPEVDDKQPVYHIGKALYKELFPEKILKNFSYLFNDRECYHDDEPVITINIKNINKKALHNLFFSSMRLNLTKYEKKYDYYDEEAIISILEQLDYVQIITATGSEHRFSGGFQNLLHTKCWIGSTFYDKMNKQEYAVILYDTSYDDSRLDVDREDTEFDDNVSNNLCIAKDIARGMFIYNCKTLDDFIQMCSSQKMDFIYDILKYPAHKNNVEFLRPKIEELYNALYN